MKLEDSFKKYLAQIPGAVNLDTLPESTFPKGKADFYIEGLNAIFEIKSINSDRSDALGPWLQRKIESNSESKNGMPVVFGTVSFKEIYEGHANKELFNRQLDSLASRTLSDYVRSAKRQIFDARQALSKTKAKGFLVILNEGFDFYETWFVYRVIQDMLIDITKNQPELKIDGVWYINESSIQKKEIDVVFIHESNELEDISPNELLDNLHQGWAKYRGYTVT